MSQIKSGKKLLQPEPASSAVGSGSHLDMELIFYIYLLQFCTLNGQ